MTEVTLTDPQRKLARHALGLTNGRTVSFRNHFVCSSGHSDYEAWEAMVAAGAAKRFKGSALSGGDFIFALTQAGALAALNCGESLDQEGFV